MNLGVFQVFIQPDVTFGSKQQFRDSFCVENVREGLVIGFVYYLTATAEGFCSNSAADLKCPPTLLLLLSKLCLEFQTTSVHHLVRSEGIVESIAAVLSTFIVETNHKL